MTGAACVCEDRTRVNDWHPSRGSAAIWTGLGPVGLAARFASATATRGRRALSEDPVVIESFEARFADQADAVGRLCRRLLGRDGSAEDAAQEVFLRAQRGYPGYDRKQPFRAWVLAITSHYCIDVLRRRTREGRLFPGERSRGRRSGR